MANPALDGIEADWQEECRWRRREYLMDWTWKWALVSALSAIALGIWLH